MTTQDDAAHQREWVRIAANYAGFREPENWHIETLLALKKQGSVHMGRRCN